MKGSFIKNLHVAFLISILLLIVSSVASFFTIKELNNRAKWVHHTEVVQRQLELLLSTIKDAETGVRGYLITNDPTTLQPYNGALQRTTRAFNTVQNLTKDNASQQQSLKELKTKITDRYKNLTIQIEQGGKNGVTEVRLKQGKQLMDNIRAKIQKMQHTEAYLLNERSKAWKNLAVITPYLIVFITILASFISYYFCNQLKLTYYSLVRAQKALQTKTIETDQRIAIIQELTDRIALGDYQIRLQDKERDVLGNISVNLNRMAISLEYSFNAIKELMTKKDDFISIAAHELKTPLTSIKAYLQFMGRMKLDNEEARKMYPFISKANAQVNRLTDIIKDLLDVSRINDGQLGLTFSTFSIREAILEVSEEVFSAIKTHELVLEGDPDIVVKADKFRIEQVLVNLISNGVKYSPNSNKVIVEIKRDKDFVRVAITDCGIGIQKDHQPYIFERYFRVEQTSQNYGGMGLGLYISKGIIEKHGGEMGVQSKYGEGSTFWFTLPIKEEV